MLVTDLLTPDQQRVLDSNFEHYGHFYVSADLHPMLDCANAPDEEVGPGDLTGDVGIESGPLGFASRGLLREEFFGGIWYDLDRHRHYMLDHDAYAAAASRVDGARKPLAGSATSEASASLLAAGILTPGTGRDARWFAADDMGQAYLQAPLIVEVELDVWLFPRVSPLRIPVVTTCRPAGRAIGCGLGESYLASGPTLAWRLCN